MIDPQKRREEELELARQFFFKRWNEIEKVVDYDLDWETPYNPRLAEKARRKGRISYSLSSIHNDRQFDKMQPGEIMKAMDDNGRKIIIVVTRLGLWVFYISSIDIKVPKLGDHRSKRLRQFQKDPVIYRRLELSTYIGSPYGLSVMSRVVARNIGERIELIYRQTTDPFFRPKSVHYVTDVSGTPLE